MTEETRKRLEELYASIMEREVAFLVRQQLDRQISSKEVAATLADLAEIGACIGTAYRALNLSKEL